MNLGHINVKESDFINAYLLKNTLKALKRGIITITVENVSINILPTLSARLSYIVCLMLLHRQKGQFFSEVSLSLPNVGFIQTL